MRTLALAFSLTALAAGAVHASEWAFDDSYWKKPDVATTFQEQSAPATTTDDSFEKYRQVDRYNPYGRSANLRSQTLIRRGSGRYPRVLPT